MPRICVYISDSFRLHCDLTPDASDARQYRVTTDERTELETLLLSHKRLQILLTTIAERPEVEFEEAWHEEAAQRITSSYEDHEYCPVCRECTTCNLRPCRDGGAHPVKGNQE